jgi:hypothetical protein
MAALLPQWRLAKVHSTETIRASVQTLRKEFLNRGPIVVFFGCLLIDGWLIRGQD